MASLQSVAHETLVESEKLDLMKRKSREKECPGKESKKWKGGKKKEKGFKKGKKGKGKGNGSEKE